MFTVSSFYGKRFIVFGLGRSGLSCVKALIAGDNKVLAWDDNIESRKKAKKIGAEISDISQIDFTNFTALILSPGIPLTHPEPHWVVKKAQEEGLPIIGDVELFIKELQHRNSQAKIIAITGTNGKSTTTALIGHILKESGFNTQIGGNIGVSVFDLDYQDSGFYVLELSSYQLDLTPSLKPDVAIILNITPDHLDRHGDINNYARVKAKVFALQDDSDLLIVGADDPMTMAIIDRIKPRCKVDAVYARPDVILDNHNINLISIASLAAKHNWQNAAIAIAVAKSFSIGAAQIIASLETFPGLEHRLENVGNIENVFYINDSKATNAEAASNALDNFDNIYWILGGRDKEDGIDGLEKYFSKINCAYLIGESTSRFSEFLSQKKLPYKNCETIANAVRVATKDALNSSSEEKAVILLSPACASFDQFIDFTARGKEFKKEVYLLDGIEKYIAG